MATKDEIQAIARLETKVDSLTKKSDLIHEGIYGNGTKGLKARVAILETKFWILVILLTPTAVWGLKNLIWGVK